MAAFFVSAHASTSDVYNASPGEETIDSTPIDGSDDSENSGESGDSENGNASSGNAPAAQSYPLLEVYAGCGKSEWWGASRDMVPDFPLLLEPLEFGAKNNASTFGIGVMLVTGGTHLMQLKVTPSSVGDTLKYSRGTVWDGAAVMEIDKDRPGGDVHEFVNGNPNPKAKNHGPAKCVPASYAEFNDPDDPLTHPLDEGNGVEVYIRVAQKSGWQAFVGTLKVTFGLGSTPGPDDLEFRYSPPVHIESVPLEGKGTTNGSGVVHSEDCPAPLSAKTVGTVSAKWLDAPPEAKVEPPACAEHISPDGAGGSNEECSQCVHE